MARKPQKGVNYKLGKAHQKLTKSRSKGYTILLVSQNYSSKSGRFPAISAIGTCETDQIVNKTLKT